MLKAELEAGRLVRPFALPYRGEKGYYLVRPKVQREARKIVLFRDWLLETVAKETGRANER
ncbi:Glycine cleavage system transcriptional activator [compost metagenome]